MNRKSQFKTDSERLATLVERYTGIPSKRVCDFIAEYGADEMLSYANLLAKTDTQKEKLQNLFEFKNLYEVVKGAEKERDYIILTTKGTCSYFTNYFSNKNDKERFCVAFLNSSNKIVATKVMSEGTINESMIYPREIIKEALFHNASSVIIAHNHPGMNPEPSDADIKLTDYIGQILKTVSIKLFDHIIVAGSKAVSMAEKGHIDRDDVMSQFQRAASAIKNNIRMNKAKSEKPSILQTLEETKKQIEQARSINPPPSKIKSDNLDL